MKLTTLINAYIRLNYVPDAWKTAKIIMIPKPGKNLNKVESYRPISLLPTMSKLFEKLVLKHLKRILDQRNLIPAHQFGFKDNHLTIDQVYRITDVIGKTLENKGVCSAIYLSNRHFRVKHNDSYSELKLIRAGVPQGSALGSVIYLIYINDVPTTLCSTTSTFADDTAIVTVGESVEISTRKLQSALNKIATWTKQFNELKFMHNEFTNKMTVHQPVR